MLAKQQTKYAILALFALFTPWLAAQQEGPLPAPGAVQETIEQWVDTRKTISVERSEWQAEKTTLEGLNQIRRKESEQLGEFAAAARERVTELAGKREDFATEEQQLKAWRKALETEIEEFEKRLRPLVSQFPPPLRAEVNEAAIRLEAIDTTAPLQNRVRDILLVVQAWQDFHNSITLDSELREIDGQKREVKLLYLGMSQAFFVDTSGRYAGFGVPTAEGWKWSEEKALAPRIQLAIEVHSRSETPQFVRLPVVSSPSTPE